MSEFPVDRPAVDRRVIQLFALVREALAGATYALLSGDILAGRAIVEADLEIDELASSLEEFVWSEIEGGTPNRSELRHLVNLLLILPELERSADLAEHVAQRAVMHIGEAMTPATRGYVQRMSEAALEMWASAATAYELRQASSVSLDEADEEIDILHERLTIDVAAGTMPAHVASEVTLIGRFYERIGDHAVNLARRIDTLEEGFGNNGM